MQNKIGTLLIFLIFNNLSTVAQDTVFLIKDTVLITPVAKTKFKGNTSVIINKSGEVIEGSLSESTYLWTGRRLVLFMEGKPVRFNEKGSVISGYLAEITALWTFSSNLLLRSGSYVVFTDEGYLLQGELLRDMQLLVNEKNIEFRHGFAVYFNHDGYVVGGTLNKREQLQDKSGKTKAYKAGTIVFFDNEYKVISSIEPGNTNQTQ